MAVFQKILLLILFLWIHFNSYSQNKNEKRVSNCAAFNYDKIIDKVPEKENILHEIYYRKAPRKDHLQEIEEIEIVDGEKNTIKIEKYNPSGYNTETTVFSDLSKKKIHTRYILIHSDTITRQNLYVLDYLNGKRVKKPDSIKVQCSSYTFFDSVAYKRNEKYKNYNPLNIHTEKPKIRTDTIALTGHQLILNYDSSKQVYQNHLSIISNNNCITTEYLYLTVPGNYIIQKNDTCRHYKEDCIYEYIASYNDSAMEVLGSKLNCRITTYEDSNNAQVTISAYYYSYASNKKIFYDKPFEIYKTIQSKNYFETEEITNFNKVTYKTIIKSVFYH